MSARRFWWFSQQSINSNTNYLYPQGQHPQPPPRRQRKILTAPMPYTTHFWNYLKSLLHRPEQLNTNSVSGEGSSFVLALFKKKTPTGYVFRVFLHSAMYLFSHPFSLSPSRNSLLSSLLKHESVWLYFTNYHVQLTAFAAATSRCVAANSPSPNYPAMSSTATTAVLNNTTLSNQTTAHH